METTSNNAEPYESSLKEEPLKHNNDVAALQQENSFLKDYCVRLSKELLQYKEQCRNKESIENHDLDSTLLRN